MCHVILSIPVVGLALFLFLPWQIALPIYIPLLAGSIFVFLVVIRAMRSPINTGPWGLIGSQADVISRLEGVGPASYVIFCKGETWSAISSEALNPGDKVEILSMRGVMPVVARLASAQGNPTGNQAS